MRDEENKLMTCRRFAATDDLLHDLSGRGPRARESLLWTAPIPDERLLLFVYLWREAGTRWGRFVFVGGPDVHKAEYVSYEPDVEFSGTDLDDCVVGSLHLRQPEALRVAELAYTTDELDLEVRFEGIHEPFSWHDNQDGCPAWVADDRFEQSCRTEGRLRLGDREVKVSGVGHRDHSWGVRKWGMLQHWKWMNATTVDDDASLHAMIMHVKGEILVNGYVNRDGQLSPIASAAATAELDSDLAHRSVSASFVDEAGREMRLEASYAAGWQMPIEHLVLNEFAMEATLDGEPAVAHVEFGWPAEYVRAISEEEG